MSKLKFGEKVLVTGSLIRNRTDRFRTWVPNNFLVIKPAIFLGMRTLYNGEMKYDNDPEDPSMYFKYTEIIEGACICIEGKKPQNVFFSQLLRI